MLINFDWWQLSAHGVLKYSKLYSYKLQLGGTRNFHELIFVFSGDKKVCEVKRKPKNKKFKDDLVILKFENELCYTDFIIKYSLNFCEQHNLQQVKISRIDIACDFNRFSNNWSGQRLIKEWFNGNVLFNSRSEFYMRGKQGLKTIPNYLRFGSYESDIRIYLYNKSKEMKEGKYKPYITELWERSGIDINRAVWRIEISINCSDFNIVSKTSGHRRNINLVSLTYDIDKKTLAKALLHKYFHFKINNFTMNKTRMKRLELFEFEIFTNTIKKDLETKVSSQADRTFYKKLNKLKNEIEEAGYDDINTIDDLIKFYQTTRDLQKFQQLNINE